MNEFIINEENALFYELGYGCDNGLFIRFKDGGVFITDARYFSEAREYIDSSVEVVCASDLYASARKELRKRGVKRLKFDPQSFSVMEFESIKKGLGLRFVPCAMLSHKRRIQKSPNEIKKLAHSAKIGAECFDEMAEFISKHGLGMSELALQKKAVEIFSDCGKRELSFEPILAISENAAKAHALPSASRFLKEADLVLLDAGVRVEGYCSDRTRTAFFMPNNFSFKKEQSFANQKINTAYQAVLKAQEMAILAVRPGVLACEVDAAARQVLKEAGLGDKFIHSTGHGVGLDIHELPRISAKSSEVLQSAMVFSIEPGVYLPSEFGIRIEDVVVVSQDGCELL